MDGVSLVKSRIAMKMSFAIIGVRFTASAQWLMDHDGMHLHLENEVVDFFEFPYQTQHDANPHKDTQGEDLSQEKQVMTEGSASMCWYRKSQLCLPKLPSFHQL